jgi:hypothetical protein
LIIVGTLSALAVASCGSTATDAPHLAARTSTSSLVSPSTTLPPAPTSTPSTPITAPPSVTYPTEIVHWPNPYHPSYDTVASLVDDSAVVALATLASPSGSTYELQLKNVFSTFWPPIPIYVSVDLVDAAHLRPSGTYVFFWASDTADNRTCIVGGLRGVMAYDAASRTVTRLDTDAGSEIPRSQSLAALESSVQAAVTAKSNQPITNLPPACALSATGLQE